MTPELFTAALIAAHDAIYKTDQLSCEFSDIAKSVCDLCSICFDMLSCGNPQVKRMLVGYVVDNQQLNINDMEGMFEMLTAPKHILD